MPATFAASDWLRRAAEIWAEADAADDLTTKRLKIMLTQLCERIAHHVAVPKEAELISKANASHPGRRCLALCVAFFLFVIMVAVVVWLSIGQTAGPSPDDVCLGVGNIAHVAPADGSCIKKSRPSRCTFRL
jgi:ferric-dicitrate binding protein FerR (iron transport regulator)